MDEKRAIFLTVVGPATYQLLKSLVQPNKSKKKTYPELKKLLEKCYYPKPSTIVQRFKFHTRISVATYITALHAICEHCDFKDTLDLMIRDHLVCGINNTGIQRRLHQETP